MIAQSTNLNATQHDGATKQIERAELLSRLGDAIDRLDERERLAIHLYYLERDSAVAAARDAIGLSRSGFYKLLAKARANLAAALREVQSSC